MLRLIKAAIFLFLLFTLGIGYQNISQSQGSGVYQVVYISNVDTPQNFDVYKSDITGQNTFRLTNIIGELFDRYADDASCSSDGSHVYLTTRGIYRVDADGTNLTEIVGEGLFDQLDLAASDDEIVFSATSPEGFPEVRDTDIYSYNLTSQSIQLLTNNTRAESYPSWSPDGIKIAFAFETTEPPVTRGIAIMNRDGSGETILLQDTFDNFDPVWSPDGSKIMFSSNRSGTYNLYTINPDGTNLSPLMTIEGNAYGRWSPDGQLISFSSNRDGNLDIYVMNADGSNLRQVTNNDATNYNQCWLLNLQAVQTVQSISLLDSTNLPVTGFDPLENGDSIDLAQLSALPLKFRANTNPATVGSVQFELSGSATASFTDDTMPYEMEWTPTVGSYTITATPWSGASGTGTAGSPRIITFTITNNLNRILYVHNNHIYLMNADGTNSVDLGVGASPSWSPDGTRIAYHAPMGGSREIFVMNSDGSNPVRLTNNAADDRDPSWSPDGTRIVYASVVTNSDWELYIMNADGTNKVQVTSNAIDDTDPSWSSTNVIVFTAQPEDYDQIYTILPNGSQRSRITNTANNTVSPEWSPDGSMIVYNTFGGTNDDIHRINANGSGALRLTNDASSDINADWSQDGSQIIFSSNRTGGSNRELYIMAMDGSAETRFTFTSSISESAPAWGYP